MENKTFTKCSLCKKPINGEISGCHCYEVSPQIFCRVDHSGEIKQAISQERSRIREELLKISYEDKWGDREIDLDEALKVVMDER